MRRLYHQPLSPFCRKIRLVLAEKKIEVELVEERTWERRMDFLRLNPAGQVPVLKIDDLVLADSTAIFEYLEETHPEPPLLPKSPALRAEARRLTAWFDDKFHNEVTANLVYERVNKKLAKAGYPGEREDQGRDAQHQVPPRLYRLADGPPALAGRRHADHRRLRGGGASVLPRLCQRRGLGAQRRACTSGTPRSSRGRRSGRSSPTWCRGSRRRSIMRTSTSDAHGRLAVRLKARAVEEGFAACGICAPDAIPEAAGRLAAFVAAGWHGQMRWMAERMGWRGSPAALWPEARSVIMLAEVYTPEEDPLAVLARRDRGAISVYARGRDYHDLVKKRLKRLGGWLVAETGAEIKVFVDTAPVMEKPLAQAAGIGWQGKHTNLLSRELGNWFFLGAIFTALELPRDAARARITAGRAGPASTSARPGRCRRPTGSMRGGASAT